MKINTSDIEASYSNSSGCHCPSDIEIKVPDVETFNPNSHRIELPALNCPKLVIYFDEKAFEDHLKASTSHAKDDFSYSRSCCRTLSIDASTSSSFLRIDNAIKETSMILDKK